MKSCGLGGHCCACERHASASREMLPAGRLARGMGLLGTAAASSSAKSAPNALLAAPSSPAPLGLASSSNTSTSRSTFAALTATQAVLCWRASWQSAAALKRYKQRHTSIIVRQPVCLQTVWVHPCRTTSAQHARSTCRTSHVSCAAARSPACHPTNTAANISEELVCMSICIDAHHCLPLQHA
jgi:hypothetical protein